MGVDRLTPMPECVQQPEDVEGDVGQVPVAVLDHQVEVDVVALAEPAAGKRARDGDADDEGTDSRQCLCERGRLPEVGPGDQGVGALALADRLCPLPGAVADHQAVAKAEVPGGDRGQDVGAGERPAQASLGEP